MSIYLTDGYQYVRINSNKSATDKLTVSHKVDLGIITIHFVQNDHLSYRKKPFYLRR